MMITKINIGCIEDIQKVQYIANKADESVSIASEDGTIIIDAKTFIGLFSLDFRHPVALVSESEKFHKMIHKELKTRIVE